MSSERQRRIVIAGTGPVGLAIAAQIASDPRSQDIELRIIDALPAKPWTSAAVDARVYALSHASRQLFEQQGLWGAMQARRVSPYRAMRVWQGDDPDGPASIAFDAAEVGMPDLGHIVEDSLIRDVLLDCLSRHSQVKVDFETAIETFEVTSRRPRVTTSAGEQIRADLLIGADGAASAVRDLAGIATFTRRYQQRAVVVHVRSEASHQETAWQRFGRRGPLALLPLADGRVSIVWSVPDGEAERLLDLSDAEFDRALEHASAGALGRLQADSPRLSFSLKLVHAARYAGQGVALAGDAAHAVHPLAGQGMNLGLLDAAALAAVIGHAHGSGEYIGDRLVLDRYARARRAHNLRMQLTFDGIDRLFRLGGVMAPLRMAGMLAVDSLPGVKRLLIEQAMGTDRRRAAPGPGRLAGQIASGR